MRSNTKGLILFRTSSLYRDRTIGAAGSGAGTEGGVLLPLDEGCGGLAGAGGLAVGGGTMLGLPTEEIAGTDPLSSIVSSSSKLSSRVVDAGGATTADGADVIIPAPPLSTSSSSSSKSLMLITLAMGTAAAGVGAGAGATLCEGWGGDEIDG